MPRQRKQGRPLKPGAVVASMVRKSQVEYPLGCDSREAQIAYDEREKEKRMGTARDMAARDSRVIQKWYIDWDLSGMAKARRKRDGLRQLELDIMDGMVAHLYIESLSRIVRGLEEGWAFIRLCWAHSCELHAPDIHDYTDSAAGRMFLSFKLSIDQYEAEIAGERWFERNYQAVKQGKWIGLTHAPYGFRYNTETKWVNLDEATAIYAQRIFELFIQTGGNYCNTAKQLNELLRASDPSAIPPGGGGKVWYPINLRRYVANGLYRRQRSYGGDVWAQNEPPEHVIPPIPQPVDAATVARVDELIASRGDRYKLRMSKSHMGSVQFTYGGLLVCAECGHSIYGALWQERRAERSESGGTARHVRWRCNGAIKHLNDCAQPAINNVRIDRLVGEALAAAIDYESQRRPDMLKEVQKVAKQQARGRAPKGDKDSIEAERRKLKQEKERLIRLYGRGVEYISEKDVLPLLAEIDGKLKALDMREAQIAAITAGEQSQRPMLTNTQIEDIAASIAARWRAPGQDDSNLMDAGKRQFLLGLGVRIEASVAKDGSLRRIYSQRSRSGTLTLTLHIDALGRTGEAAIVVSEPEVAYEPPKRQVAAARRQLGL